MFFLKATFLSLCFIFGGAHAQEPCQSLLAAEVSYSQCVALGNCTGMTCNSTINDAPASTTFVVNKCTDPLVVSVSVSNGSNITEFSPTVTGPQQLTAGDLTILFNVTRNASTLWISALAGGNDVIPQVSVPLNQTDCMCQSVSSVASSLSSTGTLQSNCFPNQQCSGIDCALSLEVNVIFTLYVEVDLQPCEKPPGILLVIRNSQFQAIYEGYFNSTDVVSISLDTLAVKVNVKITHLDYSLTVEVDVTILLGIKTFMIPIVGPAQIIVDKTQCSTTTYPIVPAPSSEDVSSSTCTIITDLAAASQESLLFQCNARTSCDGMTCKLGNLYTTDIQVLACSDPPRFYVRVTRIDTHVFSGIITKTTTVDLGQSGQLQIPIIDYGDEISIEVDLLTGFFNFVAPLSPLVRIPKDYCLCSNANCPTTPPTRTESTTSPVTAASANSSAVAVAVTVPIIILVLIIVLVLAGIIALLIWRQQKLHVSFQQMKNQDHPLIETFHKSSEEQENADDTSDYK